MSILRFAFPLLAVCIFASPRLAADELSEKLGKQFEPWMNVLKGKQETFVVDGKLSIPIDGKPQDITLTLTRYDRESFDLVLTHPEYAVEIRRRPDAIALAVPKFKIAYVGKGDADKQDHLKPDGLLQRLIGPGTSFSYLIPIIMNSESNDLISMLSGVVNIQDLGAGTWKFDDKTKLTFGAGNQILGESNGSPIDLKLKTESGAAPAYDAWPDYQVRTLTRLEIEKQLARGVRRAFEVLSPSGQLTKPAQNAKKVEHGELRWIDGHRVVLLSGTPEQIGKAHGELLKPEAMRCIDSVVYAFGTAQTVATGRWFREDLESAYARLAPHIPERHKAETTALAASLGIDNQMMQTVNVFPELFHCSGFALFGKATKDGKLYHGRVLDYMTTIGLQDASTTFIVAPQGKIPFANVGYAGFIGSVSGMNVEKISLGEMGGKGEGKWDGVPMATLMRRALEECSSLDDVKKLWQDSPRTCEYYYVFADGETKTAVGVSATPEKLEFVQPGEGHVLLGDGIPDAVVLSAGGRLEELRRRVKERYGKIDAEDGKWLMCRPVAMNSNLHNVLFVPEDGVLHVANASHKQPAAERPYVELNLPELVKSMQSEKVVNLTSLETTREISTNLQLVGSDSLNAPVDDSADASNCLKGLTWTPEKFQIRFEKADKDKGDWLVRFPSPKPSGNAVNDEVAMEWYMARDAQGQPIQAPAAVIVHESGSGMTVGRIIARALGRQGVHAFMIQLPFYGKRRHGERPTGDALIGALQQGITDVRRAHDTVAAIPNVDAKRISLQGTSLGGFVTATTAGIDHSYYRVIIFLAGGDLYSVVMNGENEAASMREDLAKAGLNESNVKSFLNTIEPLRLAHRVDASSTWLFSGKYDQVVPPRNSALFAAAAKLQPTHHIEMEVDHYSGALLLPQIIKQMRDLMTTE